MKHQPPSAWAPWESHTTHPRTAITITGVLQNVIFTCAIELTLYWWIWSGQYYWKLVKCWSIDLKILYKDYRHKASHEVNLGIILGEREGVQIIKSSPHQCWGRRTIDAPAGRSTLRRPLTVQCWNTCASKTLMSPDLYLWYLKSTLSFRKSDMAIITCWLCVTLRNVCCGIPACLQGCHLVAQHLSFYALHSPEHTAVHVQEVGGSSCIQPGPFSLSFMCLVPTKC